MGHRHRLQGGDLVSAERRIRSNAAHIILTSGRARRESQDLTSPHNSNLILDLARDTVDGALYGWAMGWLWAVETLRMEWDSPRIGGGIDPALATGLTGSREDSPELAYIDGELERFAAFNIDANGWDAEYANDRIQDMIVHTEAVLDLIINQCTIAGKDY